MAKQNPSNEDIAALLDRIADLLEIQGANPFRIRSYRDGANTLRQADRSVSDLVEEDRLDELKKMPNIGSGLAALIGEYVDSGQSDLLQRLQTEVDPVQAFSQLPGMDKELAQRVVDQLDIATYQELERATYNGNLEQVEGFDQHKVKTLQTALAGMLSGAAQNRVERMRAEAEGKETPDRPNIEDLLAVDEEYRKKAESGSLKQIAPKRFNPDNEAWLPILNTKRAGWDFTALYSNTAQAHKLDKTHDWVVIYFEKGGLESQSTVVTGSSGELDGKRVVRGREMETKQFYQSKQKEGS